MKTKERPWESERPGLISQALQFIRYLTTERLLNLLASSLEERKSGNGRSVGSGV